MQDWLRDLRLALGFLSRLPLGGRGVEVDDRPLAEAARAFGLAGALLGLIGAGVAAIGLAIGLGAILSALIALAVMVVVTGALHEDGFADFADAMGARGGADARLAVMRDSRIGTFGALALVFLVLGKAAALAEILLHGPAAALLLVAAAAVSRGLIPWAMQYLPLARSGGLASWAGTPQGRAPAAALGLAAALALLAGFAAGQPMAVLVGLAGAGLAGFAVAVLARRTLGGYTGDVLGAVQQAAELGFLLLAVTAL